MNDELEIEMISISNELGNVMTELAKLRERQEKNLPAKKEALQFIEKAEKVIALAEQGKIDISLDQKLKIEETLKKISIIFKK